MHSIIPATREVKIGRLWFEASLGKKVKMPISKNKQGMVPHGLISDTQEAEVEDQSEAGHGKKKKKKKGV